MSSEEIDNYNSNYNSNIYLFYIISIGALLLPLFIGLASSNKIEGGIKGTIGTAALIGLPILVFYISPKEGFSNLTYASISFSITFIIVIIYMFNTS